MKRMWLRKSGEWNEIFDDIVSREVMELDAEGMRITWGVFQEFMLNLALLVDEGEGFMTYDRTRDKMRHTLMHQCAALRTALIWWYG
jgi:hypothetical protein